MLTLHCAPLTVSVAIAIAIEELGLDCELIWLDFANAAQTKPDYLQINPKGRVPTLIVDGQTLTETGAILEYLAQHAGRMLPSDPFELAKLRELMLYLASTVHVAHAHKHRGSRWADKQSSFVDMRSRVAGNMAASCAYLEQTLPLAPFALGDAISIADPYLFIVTNWLSGDGVDISDYPKLANFYATMSDRASVKTIRSQGLLG